MRIFDVLRLRGRIATSALLASLGASGCASKPAVCSAPQGSDSAVQSLAADDTAFALALYAPAVAAAGAGPNVILSPYSVSATLTMLDVGAAGETAAQIQAVLGLPANGAAMAPAYAALACDDETDGSSHGNQLSIANSLWGQQGTVFQPSFLSVLAGGYASPLQQADFAGDAAGATSAIDTWVSDRTQGRIPALFDAGDLTSQTRFVLVNAVYFNGVWDQGFSPSATTPQPFTLGDGTAVQVPTMTANVDLGQGTGEGFMVYELPYEGGTMVMDFLVPAGALSALEASLTPQALGAALGSLGPRSQVDLSLPRFTFSTRVVLDPVLAGLGMPDVFMAGKADLSGVDGEEDLFVSLVVQQAFIEVDERGTVATAATGAVGDVEFGGADEVDIDRPFLFIVRDVSTASILFLGRVEDPREGP